MPIPHWAEKYLICLGVSEKEPSYKYLEELCTAHLNRVPFANISKLIWHHRYDTNKQVIPSVEQYVDWITQYNLGGTCYFNNIHFKDLLFTLGFDCRNVYLKQTHVAILVRVPEFGEEWLYVDVGSAAPFFKPVRIETAPDQITQYGDKTVTIRSDQEQTYWFKRYVNGKLTDPIWHFTLDEPFHWDDFQEIIIHSYRKEAPFMGIIRCQLYQTDLGRNLSLVNNQLWIISETGEIVEIKILHSIDDYKDVFEKDFRLPNVPIEEALAILRERNIMF